MAKKVNDIVAARQRLTKASSFARIKGSALSQVGSWLPTATETDADEMLDLEDAISTPTQVQERQKTIQQMHQNRSVVEIGLSLEKAGTNRYLGRSVTVMLGQLVV
jgi:hypothetical protein